MIVHKWILMEIGDLKGVEINLYNSWKALHLLQLAFWQNDIHITTYLCQQDIDNINFKYGFWVCYLCLTVNLTIMCKHAIVETICIYLNQENIWKRYKKLNKMSGRIKMSCKIDYEKTTCSNILVVSWYFISNSAGVLLYYPTWVLPYQILLEPPS